MMADTNQICWQITNQLGYLDGNHGVLIAGMMEQRDMVKISQERRCSLPLGAQLHLFIHFPSSEGLLKTALNVYV